jgi:hypothetical protein
MEGGIQCYLDATPATHKAQMAPSYSTHQPLLNFNINLYIKNIKLSLTPYENCKKTITKKNLK